MAKEGLGGERTERATSKKRSDARKEGQVLKSMEVNTTVLIFAMFATLKVMGPWTAGVLADNAARYLSHAAEFSGGADAYVALSDQLLRILLGVSPFLAVSLVVGIAVNVAQVGFLFTTKPLMPKFSKINPFTGFKRLFSLTALVTLFKSILKIAIIGYVIYNEYKNNIDSVVLVVGQNTFYTTSVVILDAVVNVGYKAGLAMCVIAAIDFFYSWWRHEEDLKMSKQEVKEEYKLTEGNPEIKGKIKQKQRQMGMLRMMRAVPEADVVITNPTHYAVALKYDDKKTAAPLVLAKGQDYVAKRIKETALEHGVMIVENKPLAQGLYRLCEIGEQIPESLYQAVAEVLVYVYNAKHATTGRARRA